MIFNQIFNAGEHRLRPIIGIVPTQLSDQDSILMPNRYVNAIAEAGGAPLILPLNAETEVYETLFPEIDGFVLSGGQDITPELYGATEHSEKLSDLTPNRDEMEALVLSYAYKYDVPVLGICRGMQMINVYFGGTLYEDLADQFTPHEADQPAVAVVHKQETDYSKPTHFVKIMRDSKLSQILDTEELATNSMHHQGVRQLGPLLDATAYGPDGLIEAIEVRDRSFIVGVQWHPEFFAGEKAMGCIFNSLIMQSEIARATGRAGAKADLSDSDKISAWEEAHHAGN